ncbi:TlpA family protein disulfide reductase [Amycolatopsis pigmentata]|uniref:TlpA family protein disulfide reductase n=1 Tax=Amycolatopsis pigmentata TaxID=450801 RepID=A0ABW5FUJ3_9PSEU
MTGLWIVAGVLVVGVIAGMVLRAGNGRIRATGRERGLPESVVSALDPQSAVTLVQISTTFCAPCRQTRALLSSLAEKTEGLRHVDLDVTDRPEVAQALGVLRTPTTLAFTPSGEELLRISGVPSGPAVLDALAGPLSRVS